MHTSPSVGERRFERGRPSAPPLIRLGQTQFWFILGASVVAITLVGLLAALNF